MNKTTKTANFIFVVTKQYFCIWLISKPISNISLDISEWLSLLLLYSLYLIWKWLVFFWTKKKWNLKVYLNVCKRNSMKQWSFSLFKRAWFESSISSQDKTQSDFVPTDLTYELRRLNFVQQFMKLLPIPFYELILWALIWFFQEFLLVMHKFNTAKLWLEIMELQFSYLRILRVVIW